ncbi:FMN reductase (NADH) RutF [compost metagenome]
MLQGALASFDCVVAELFVTPSHAIIIGEIRDLKVAQERPPLMYYDGTYGTLEAL